MKRISVSILLLLSIMLLSAQKQKKGADIEKINLKPIEVVDNKIFQEIDKETNLSDFLQRQ